MFCLSGEATVYLKGRAEKMYKGKILMINRGEVHSAEADSDNIILVAHIRISRKVTMKNETISAEKMEELADRLMVLTFLYSADEIIDDEEYWKMCMDIVDFTEKHFKVEVKGSNRSLVSEMIETTRMKHNADISIDSFAKKYGVSTQYLSGLFKKAGVGTYSEYWNDIKCCEADKMVLDSCISISEIAKQCGFSSVKTFIKHYKKYSGKTPLQKRKDYNKIKLPRPGGVVDCVPHVTSELICKTFGAREIKKRRGFV